MQQCRSPMQLRKFEASVAPMQHALRRGAASYAWSLQHRHLLTTTSSGALLGVGGTLVAARKKPEEGRPYLAMPGGSA